METMRRLFYAKKSFKQLKAEKTRLENKLGHKFLKQVWKKLLFARKWTKMMRIEHGPDVLLVNDSSLLA